MAITKPDFQGQTWNGSAFPVSDPNVLEFLQNTCAVQQVESALLELEWSSTRGAGNTADTATADMVGDGRVALAGIARPLTREASPPADIRANAPCRTPAASSFCARSGVSSR